MGNIHVEEVVQEEISFKHKVYGRRTTENRRRKKYHGPQMHNKHRTRTNHNYSPSAFSSGDLKIFNIYSF